MSFLGALGSLGRLLPGYMQGERQAIQDNWNDLNQYNKVQAGQLQNMFDENAMRDRLNMMRDAAIERGIRREAMGWDLWAKVLGVPRYAMQEAYALGHLPELQQMRYNMTRQQYGMAMNPRLPAAQGKSQQGGALPQAMFGGGSGWQYGLGGGYGYGGYGLGGGYGYGGYGLGGLGYGPSRI